MHHQGFHCGIRRIRVQLCIVVLRTHLPDNQSSANVVRSLISLYISRNGFDPDAGTPDAIV